MALYSWLLVVAYVHSIHVRWWQTVTTLCGDWCLSETQPLGTVIHTHSLIARLGIYNVHIWWIMHSWKAIPLAHCRKIHNPSAELIWTVVFHSGKVKHIAILYWQCLWICHPLMDLFLMIKHRLSCVTDSRGSTEFCDLWLICNFSSPVYSNKRHHINNVVAQSIPL